MTANPCVPGSSSTQPMPSRPGLPSTRREHDEHARLRRAADQRLGALQDHPVADDARIGAVIGHIRAGMRLGHADRQDAVAADHARQDALADRRPGRSGRSPASAPPPRPAPPWRSRNRPWRSPPGSAPYPGSASPARHIPPAPTCPARPARRAASCSPRGTCRPSSAAALALNSVCASVAHRGDHLPLLRIDLEVHCLASSPEPASVVAPRPNATPAPCMAPTLIGVASGQPTIRLAQEPVQQPLIRL